MRCWGSRGEDRERNADRHPASVFAILAAPTAPRVSTVFVLRSSAVKTLTPSFRLGCFTELRLAEDEVVHHHDVLRFSSSGPGPDIAADDFDSAIRASSNTTPKNDKLASPGDGGTTLE